MAIISKTYSRLLAIIMAWLGFSCEQPDNGGGMICPEYGVPMATYKAKGIVVSQADNAPIEGIRAVLKAKLDATGERFHGIDTVYTDSKGTFYLKGQNMSSKMLYVELRDIDGEQNGSFTDMDVVADYSNEKFTGKKDCLYLGEIEKDLEIIKIKPKE